MIMNKRVAIDTNMLIYALDTAYPTQKQLSENIINEYPFICSQNISEFANVCLRKFKFEKQVTIEIINKLLKKCILSSCKSSTYLLVERLIKQYQFQLFDAIIVASAIESECEVLYSEDLHNGLLVDNQLLIQNPFI